MYICSDVTLCFKSAHLYTLHKGINIYEYYADNVLFAFEAIVFAVYRIIHFAIDLRYLLRFSVYLIFRNIMVEPKSANMLPE